MSKVRPGEVKKFTIGVVVILSVVLGPIFVSVINLYGRPILDGKGLLLSKSDSWTLKEGLRCYVGVRMDGYNGVLDYQWKTECDEVNLRPGQRVTFKYRTGQYYGTYLYRSDLNMKRI